MSLDATLQALADGKRRGAVELLKKGPRRAGELASELKLTPAAMSRHLRVLRASGLVAEDHQGEDARVRTYRLQQQPFDELKSWVDDVEQFWSLQLAAFQRHVERTRPKAPAPKRGARAS